jgi:hypothetical protein
VLARLGELAVCLLQLPPPHVRVADRRAALPVAGPLVLQLTVGDQPFLVLQPLESAQPDVALDVQLGEAFTMRTLETGRYRSEQRPGA